MSRIISIVKKKIVTETLWNLAVDEDQSYVANGIVVHNCDSYIVPVLKGDLQGREITGLPTLNKLEKSQIQLCEHDHDV